MKTENIELSKEIIDLLKKTLEKYVKEIEGIVEDGDNYMRITIKNKKL